MKFLEPTDICDVCIVGGGYSGMNLARLLTKNGINCKIYSAGYGASNLWAGTVDLLNFSCENLTVELAKFQVSIPQHPYSKIGMDLINDSLDEFFDVFPDLTAFKDGINYINQPILTMLGNLKLCVGLWSTIFKDFDKLNAESICVLIEFEEFNNSAMFLVAKGLQSQFPGTFLVLTLSLSEILAQIDPELAKKINNDKISLNNLASFFDLHNFSMGIFAEYIKSEIEIQYPKILSDKISYYLFPPVLGIEPKKIISSLNNHLHGECFELAALTTSLMSRRLINQFEQKLELLSLKINKGFVLTSLERNGLNWNCIFEKGKGEKLHVITKNVVIATGSLFIKGFLADEVATANKFHELELEFPGGLGPYFEIKSTKNNSNIFAIGSAAFLMSQCTDEDEYRDGTGLGVSISSSYAVAQKIIQDSKK
jgi:anaerobic glycerol-3-phosphate dehydrogenase